MALFASRRSVMSLYSDANDAACHAVRIVLAEKAINVEIMDVTPEDRPEDLNALNPYDTILTLVDRELVLYEPQIIMEYLDERFPHPPLMPVDPVSRANNRLYRYRVQRDMYSVMHQLDRGDAGSVSARRRALRDHLTAIAPAFSQKKFFMSDEFSLADCFVAPVLWRLQHYQLKLPNQAKGLRTYADRLFEREAFAASLSEVEREMGMR